MAETYTVFNDQLELYSHKFIAQTAPISIEESQDKDFEKRKILALLFEQFLLFDRVAIKVDQQNLELYFLIRELGIDKVQELIERNTIIPVLWTPGIYMITGTQREDRSIDESTIIGRPPIISGWLHEENPEKNLDRLLSYFQLPKGRKISFKKAVAKKYILPNNNLAKQSSEIVMDAYTKRRLVGLGLKTGVEPELLNSEERRKLFELGNEVLKTSVLAEKFYRSYDKYSSFHLCEEAVLNIEAAYHVSENTSRILTLEKVADIKSLILENKMPFERVFDLRYKADIKNYRKWINSISENTDATYITKEFINEVEGKNNFFQSKGGKFIKTLGTFAVGSGVAAALQGAGGLFAGVAAAKATEFGLSLLDTYVIDGLLKGWNPRMFVDSIKLESGDDSIEENLNNLQ